MENAAHRPLPEAEGVGSLVDLRGSIWSILSDVTTDAERIVLDANTPSHEVPRIIRFINDVKATAEKMLGPSRNARPTLVLRSIERLRSQCVDELAVLAERLDQASRRARGLVNRKRTSRLRLEPTVDVVRVDVEAVAFRVTEDDSTALTTDS